MDSKIADDGVDHTQQYLQGSSAVLRHHQHLYREISTETGGGFAMGAIGGGILHGVKGFQTAPKGYQLRSAWSAMSVRGPVVGANWATFCGLLAAYRCGFEKVRQKDDGWK